MKEEFERWAGRPPAGVWWAPGRVNLIGEHTDYNDGFVLPVAINLGVTAAAAARDDGDFRFRSLQKGPGDESWLAYPQGVAWALGEVGASLVGADVLVDSTLPEGAGLSSSAALEVAVAQALLGVAGETMPPLDIAGACRRAEEEVAGMPCGPMDQTIAVLGQAGHAMLIDTRALDLDAIPLRLEDAGLELVVIDTGVAHALRDSAYSERRRECEEAARLLGVRALRDVGLDAVERLEGTLLRRARHVVSENGRVLQAAEALRRGEPEALGPLLFASHESLRDDFEVSTPELDRVVESAREAGALGARLTGAGFGGSVLVLVETARVASLSPLRPLHVQASDGARRIA